MNQIFHINLGGTALTIDHDAYSVLKEYLLELHKHFENTEEKEEITSDIEQRIGEILDELRGTAMIVSTANVEQAISMMGRPSDFHEEEAETPTEEKTKDHSFKNFSSKFGKRLFRDTDEALLGGVCSGFSAYLGIQNPAIIRLLFILFIFGFGVSFLFYILLWIVIPEAKTNSERLQMRGEKVNVENLSKIIKEEANRFSKKVKDLGEEWNEKLGNNKFASNLNNNDNLEDQLGKVEDHVKKVGDHVRDSFKNLPPVAEQIARVVKNLVGGLGLVGTTFLWIGFIALVVKGSQFLNLLPNINNSSSGLLTMNIILLIGMPILFLGYKFTQILFNTRIKKVFSGLLTGIWIASVISFFYMMSDTANHYSESSTTSESVTFSQNMDVINFKGSLMDNSEQFHLLNFLDGSGITHESEEFDILHFEFRESSSDEVKIEVHKTARGKTEEKANKLAQKIQVDITQEGNDINIPLNVSNLVDGKFVVPSVKLVFFVPKGKVVQFDEKILQRMPYFTDKGTCEKYTLGENGFTCATTNETAVPEENSTL